MSKQTTHENLKNKNKQFLTLTNFNFISTFMIKNKIMFCYLKN